MTTDTEQSHTATRSPLAVGWLRFALAVTFLTRLPLPVRGDVTPDDLRASMGWYAPIGAVLGALGYGLYLAGAYAFTAPVAAALTIVLLEMATGALHLDGFMDTCDGVGSGAPPARALEIMKDSRVGAMGVFGGIAILGLKAVTLAALPPAASLPALLAGWAAARAVPAWAVLLFPYARAQGTGGAFTQGRAPLAAPVGTLVALAAGWLAGGLPGACLAFAALLLPLLVQAVIARRLGGLTGDVYGMGIELGEVLALLGAVALRGH
jgi:adenosylcobinamide-GDP ribazoletransferase